jgi:phosphohistidine phosphatase SixA
VRLILFRHGPNAVADRDPWRDELGSARADAIDRTHAASAGLARFEPRIALILSSPLAAATRTARMLHAWLPASRLEVVDALRPSTPLEATLAAVGTVAASRVVLVGHDPDLARLAASLMFRAPSALRIKKAGACAFDFVARPEPGAGRLAWFLPPKALRKMAGKKKRRPHADAALLAR